MIGVNTRKWLFKSREIVGFLREDDFMFGKVMHHPERCRKLLEIILGIRIRKVIFLDEQDAMTPDYDAKGIRLDIYLEDAENTVYNVEMQTQNEGDLPERSRYYQAVIDINLIEKGTNYKMLKRSYIIFICTFDMFDRGRHIYHFENLCREDPSVRLNDGTEKIFLNTKGTPLYKFFHKKVSYRTFWCIMSLL